MQFQGVSRDLLGVVLAGGLGRRLGGGKPSVILAGRPLLEHVLLRLEPQLAAGRMVVNANDPLPQIAGRRLSTIADEIGGRPGPLAGLHAGLLAAARLSPPAAWVLTVPADTPFLPRNLAANLLAAAKTGDTPIVLAGSAQGVCQVCGLWSAALALEVADALRSGQNKVMAFAERHGWQRVDFPSEPVGAELVDPFFNVNTPADVETASDLLKASGL